MVGLRERVVVEAAVEDELSIVDEAAESVVTLSSKLAAVTAERPVEGIGFGLVDGLRCKGCCVLESKSLGPRVSCHALASQQICHDIERVMRKYLDRCIPSVRFGRPLHLRNRLNLACFDGRRAPSVSFGDMCSVGLINASLLACYRLERWIDISLSIPVGQQRLLALDRSALELRWRSHVHSQVTEHASSGLGWRALHCHFLRWCRSAHCDTSFEDDEAWMLCCVVLETSNVVGIAMHASDWW